MGIKEDSSVYVYLNGLGLGSIAAAMYLIQKADFEPSNIHIFEQKGDHDLLGGSCDASHQTVNGEPAYFMQGSRMFEDKVYPSPKNCGPSFRTTTMNRVCRTIRRTGKNAELTPSFAFCMRTAKRTPGINWA
jgi:hypothetical protein